MGLVRRFERNTRLHSGGRRPAERGKGEAVLRREQEREGQREKHREKNLLGRRKSLAYRARFGITSATNQEAKKRQGRPGGVMRGSIFSEAVLIRGSAHGREVRQGQLIPWPKPLATRKIRPGSAGGLDG